MQVGTTSIQNFQACSQWRVKGRSVPQLFLDNRWHFSYFLWKMLVHVTLHCCSFYSVLIASQMHPSNLSSNKTVTGRSIPTTCAAQNCKWSCTCTTTTMNCCGTHTTDGLTGIPTHIRTNVLNSSYGTAHPLTVTGFFEPAQIPLCFPGATQYCTHTMCKCKYLLHTMIPGNLDEWVTQLPTSLSPVQVRVPAPAAVLNPRQQHFGNLTYDLKHFFSSLISQR